jgi:hypothetical protein
MFNCPKCGNKTYPLVIEGNSHQKRSYILCDCGWTNCPSRHLQELKDLKENVITDSSPASFERFKEIFLKETTRKAEPIEQPEPVKEEE